MTMTAFMRSNSDLNMRKISTVMISLNKFVSRPERHLTLFSELSHIILDSNRLSLLSYTTI